MTVVHHIHPEPQGFWRKYIWSTDHKVIAKQFLWAGLIFLAVGGALAMMIRTQWAFPDAGLFTPAGYTRIFTMHGLIMIFFAITPILIGAFGNFTIPLLIGARDMAFPRLNAMSFWTFVVALIIVVASLLTPERGAGSGWTLYPPLSTNVGLPGWGQTLVLIALFVSGVSTIMGAVNYITTVIRFRAPGMTYMKMPLTVWGLWLTAILNLLFVPIIGSAALLLLFDRLFHTQFFIAGAMGGTGDPLLFQHLFWIFGHPEVYILILPVWGFVGDLVSFFARKPAFWYRGTVGALLIVTVLSALVYGHHMYVSGMSPMLGLAFEALTLSISVPAVVLFGNWLMTLWRGSIRLTVPMVAALATIFVFGLGGLTGLLLGTIVTDIYLHDTMWVVGHFHLTMAAATFLGSFAALYYWFPKMFGRELHAGLGHAHVLLSVVLITAVFGMQLLAGLAGQQRRLFDPFVYRYIEPLRDLNRATSYAAFALAASQLLFVCNFFNALVRGKRAEANPWQVGTLEWTISSPPPHYNFKDVPKVVTGPHEFANPVVLEKLGRDWLAQTEPDPALEPDEPGSQTSA
jgi:cytochrome c oxidase subunit I